jgi:hypothetical protein
MMIDLIRRLDRFASLGAYRYVGLGSPYFSDFSLIHRTLGIRDLVSIEREQSDEPRFRFNVPFATVELKFGDTSEVLPELDWQQRSIVWLDYDGSLDDAKLADVALLVNKLASGSILAVTVNVQPHYVIDERLDVTRQQLGTYLPRRYTAKTLGGWGLAEAVHEILDEHIRRSLADRNAGISTHAAIHYRQLFHFRYRDGARMLTIGGILFDAGVTARVDGCAFGDFDFFRDAGVPYEIAVPRLTLREMRHLDGRLPANSLDDLATEGIPAADVQRYAELYRYFPKFIDVEQ